MIGVQRVRVHCLARPGGAPIGGERDVDVVWVGGGVISDPDGVGGGVVCETLRHVAAAVDGRVSGDRDLDGGAPAIRGRDPGCEVEGGRVVGQVAVGVAPKKAHQRAAVRAEHQARELSIIGVTVVDGRS